MNGDQFGWGANMGRGCECCTKDARSCCPENVFTDEDSAIALYVLYEHIDQDKNIQIEFETDNISRTEVFNFAAKSEKTYYLRFIFSKSGPIILDKSPICDSGCPPPIPAIRPIFKTVVLNLNSFFDKNLSRHKFFVWVDGERTTGPSGTPNGPMPVNNMSSALYCIKKYSGDPSYIYNSEHYKDLCSANEYILEDSIYYNSATYDYEGNYWGTNSKYGCICACTDIYTGSLPDYEVEDNIEFTFDDCGLVDGLSGECGKIFYFTVTSRSTETGIELVCTDRIEFGFFQAVHNFKCGDEEESKHVQQLLFNQRYVPPIAKVVKPYSETDVIIVTIEFSVEYIDCEGLLGCDNCPEGSREKCFCFKDQYSLSANTFELRMIEPCVFEYDSIYTVNINRTYRSRNLLVDYSKFKLTISNIYIDFDPLFWTEECKESYRNLIKALEGTYEFILDNDGCGTLNLINTREVIGQSSFPCSCFTGGVYFGNLNLDIVKYAEGISLSTCKGLAPAGNSFSDGVIGSVAKGLIGYTKRGDSSDDSGCYWSIGGMTFPIPNYNINNFPVIGNTVPFDFSWIGGFCNEIIQAINQKVSYCKGCEYVNKNIDVSSIKYKYSDLFPMVTEFDCDLEGEFS